jgi:DNA-binding HxlR family transcriptional regulator
MSTSVKKRSDSHPGEFAAFCPRFHRAVELIGRRWTGAIVRAMLSGPQRFSQLAALVPGLSDRLLSERLRELEDEGIVKRSVDDGPPVRVSYALTQAGLDLDRAMRELGSWAERWIPLKRVS